MNISGTGAIVTGGGSGLGAATARHLADKGAKVVIFDFDGNKAQAIADDIGGHAIAADVRSEAAVAQAVDAAATWCGAAPRIAVSCAGVAAGARIVGRDGGLSTELFENTLKVNLFGSYYVMSHAARLMLATTATADGERGVIINTASVAFEDGQVGQAAYAASKGAVAAMSLPAAREFAKFGVRVMAIAPGLFHTPMMEGLPQDVTDKIVSDVQFPKRLGQPEEYAHLAAHIIENAYLNGSTIRLDAGTRLPPK